MALAVDYHGQPSGRVRAVPDRRAIRWYTTIGLIDRPVAHRGRTALYGPRHLLQLVAVKRLQARGLPLVAIQQELAGATDNQLARVARLPLDARPTVAPGPVPAVVVPDGGDPPTGRVADRRAAADPPRSAAPAPPAAVVPRALPPRFRRSRGRLPPCTGYGSGLGPPCCWSRGGSWPRPTSTRSSPPPGRCWPSSGTEGSMAGRGPGTRTRTGSRTRSPTTKLVPRGGRRTNPEGSIHDLPAPAER